MWALFAVASAIFLGTYDVFKKLSLNKNAVLPVFFFSTLTYATIFIPFVLISAYDPILLNDSIFFVPKAPLIQHGYFFLKSLISVISALRRDGVIISFILGAILFHEHNVRKKGWLLLGIVTGVVILLFGSR